MSWIRGECTQRSHAQVQNKNCCKNSREYAIQLFTIMTRIHSSLFTLFISIWIVTDIHTCVAEWSIKKLSISLGSASWRRTLLSLWIVSAIDIVQKFTKFTFRSFLALLFVLLLLLDPANDTILYYVGIGLKIGECSFLTICPFGYVVNFTLHECKITPT